MNVQHRLNADEPRIVGRNCLYQLAPAHPIDAHCSPGLGHRGAITRHANDLAGSPVSSPPPRDIMGRMLRELNVERRLKEAVPVQPEAEHPAAQHSWAIEWRARDILDDVGNSRFLEALPCVFYEIWIAGSEARAASAHGAVSLAWWRCPYKVVADQGNRKGVGLNERPAPIPWLRLDVDSGDVESGTSQANRYATGTTVEVEGSQGSWIIPQERAA